MKNKLSRFLLICIPVIIGTYLPVCTCAQNVGIGIITPAAKLHIKGAADTTQLIIDANSTQSNTHPLITLRNSSGTDLMWIHSDDTSNIFIGLNAGRVNNVAGVGIYNTFIGSRAGYSNTVGNENTANGNLALHFNTSGAANTAIGSYALCLNTTGNYNTANGKSALYANTSGSFNTAIGSGALFSNTTGSYNIANGYGALLNNSTGSYNIASGYDALSYNVAGSYATALGQGAMFFANNTATPFTNSNVAVGFEALRGSTTPADNTGNQNTAIGYQSLLNNTSGNNNTANGYLALTNNTTGSWNTCLGENTNVSVSNLDGATAIGTGAITNASNKIVIGAALPGIMVIGGYAPWSIFSDGRFKTNITEDVRGLSFISKLKPVTYNIDNKKLDLFLTQHMPDSIAKQYIKANETYEKNLQFRYTGFIAQDVEKLANDLGWKFDGVNVPKNSGDNYSIAYSQFVMPLVKAVQEQQEMITKQTITITDQARIIQDLVKRISALENK